MGLDFRYIEGQTPLSEEEKEELLNQYLGKMCLPGIIPIL